MPTRMLIFRRGSIGDAVASLPALRYLARQHPNCQRRLLTNRPVMNSAAPIEAVIGTGDLIHGYAYLWRTGSGLGEIVRLVREIRDWKPDLLVYLSEPSKPARLFAERLFFRACGIKQTLGLPMSPELRRYARTEDGLWESESRRLLRAVGAPVEEAADFTLDIPAADSAGLDPELFSWCRSVPHIAFSVGAKLPDKDWGDGNWSKVLSQVSANHPELGLLMVGADEDRQRSEKLGAHWSGPVRNICGITDPRQSAAAMRHAQFYLGHDSGPMHLAALVGLKCISVFAARAKPGVWFPHGSGHRTFYPWPAADDVPATPGFRHAGASIHTIEWEQILAACLELLSQEIPAGNSAGSAG